MNNFSRFVTLLGLVVTGVAMITNGALAADAIRVTKTPVDHATLHTATIAKDVSLIVHAFSIEGAKLGKSKHRDIAQRLARIAPHLLVVDVVEMLRRHGFTSVSLDESAQESGGGALQLTGKFTVLDPGSQAARAWIGFGAGESKICVQGQVRNADGEALAEFKDCQKGLGWGNSASQTEEEATRIGDNIASLLVQWAEGRL